MDIEFTRLIKLTFNLEESDRLSPAVQADKLCRYFLLCHTSPKPDVKSRYFNASNTLNRAKCLACCLDQSEWRLHDVLLQPIRVTLTVF